MFLIKKICENAVEKLPFVIKVPVQYKTKKMCGKVIPEDGLVLGFFPDCYKNKKMRDKVVDNYFHALRFVPDSIRLKNCVAKLSVLIHL